MQTRSYTDLYALIQSLFGANFASVEATRINSLVNRRATLAYQATEYWPRFLKVGEERTITSGVIPYTQEGLSEIDTFLRVHRTQPYYQSTSQNYDFYVEGDGAHLIIGADTASTAWVTYRIVNDAVYGTGATDTPDVPKEWFDYLAYGAYADAMRMDGQTEKAVIADQEANDILTTQLIRVSERCPSFLTTQISTNANRQNRYWS